MSGVLTAAVATYNGRALLERLLPTVAAQTLPGVRVVVVDDGSSDDTVAWLAEHWPQVEVVAHSRNRGVTAALNSSFGAADGEFVALLNNDLELEPSCLAELVTALRKHPGAGVACAKLVDYHDRDRLDGAGDVYSWGGEANRRAHGELDSGRYDTAQEIFSACAGAAVYRLTAVADVGRFDDAFYAFYEDVDWSFRAQLAGWRCLYVPSAVAYHVGSASVGREPSDFVLFHNWRNQIWVIAKDWPLAVLLVHLPQVLWVQGRNLGIAIKRRRFGLWVRVWRSALAGLPAVWRRRRRVQGSRRISLRELHRRVAGGR